MCLSKKIIGLPNTDKSKPSDIRIITAKRLEEIKNDKKWTWREFIIHPSEPKQSEGKITITTFGNTQIWELKENNK